MIDQSQLDLGEVWESPEFEAVLTIRNTAAEPRAIRAFASSCDCARVRPQQLTIPANQTATVTATLDLTHKLPYQRGLARRTATVRIDPIFVGDFAPTPGWEIKTIIRSRLSLETSHLAFGDACVHGGPPVSREVRVTAHQPLQRVEAVVPTGFATARIESNGQGQYRVVITPASGLAIGPFRFRVPIQAIAPDGSVHLCGSIDVSGEMQSPVRILPRIVLLGEHAIPGRGEADVTVKLPGAGWTMERIELSSPDTIVKRSEADADGAIHYRITQHVRQPGDHLATATFVARDKTGKQERVSLEIRYHGLADSR